MRMWNVDPKLMCRQHLLGEHLEVHMMENAFRDGKQLKGFIINNLIDPGNVQERHEELAVEMNARGYNHKSPLVSHRNHQGHIDADKNLTTLRERCKACAERQELALLAQSVDAQH